MEGTDVEVTGPDGPIGAIDWGGDGAPIVLLHGGGSNAGEWESTVPFLIDEHRCVSIDSYGHGRTPTPRTVGFDGLLETIDAVIDQFALLREQVTLVGSSFGGALAVWYARVRPGCRAVIGVDSAPTRSHVQGWPATDRVEHSPDLYRSQGWEWSGDQQAHADRVAALVAEGEPAASVRRAHRLESDGLYHSVPEVTFLADFHNLGNRSDNPIVQVDNFALLHCPVLLLCATRGPSSSNREWVDSMPERFPSVSVIWMDGSHRLNVDQPEAVALQIRRFLAAAF